jgi:hypothetical protein
MEEEWLELGVDDAGNETEFQQLSRDWQAWKEAVRRIGSEQAEAAFQLAQQARINDLQQLHLAVKALSVVGRTPAAREARQRFQASMGRFLREWTEFLKRLP